MNLMFKAAVSGCALCAGVASAQQVAAPHVIVFGVVDLAARRVDNDGVGALSSLASGSNLTSRFGVRGSEPISADLSATFHLESTLNGDTGVGGNTAPASQFWDRRSTVSLVSKQAGELRLGRDFSPTYSAWGRYDPFGYVGLASSGNFISGTVVGPIRAAFSTSPNTLVRSSNMVQWLLPQGWGGLEGGVAVAAGEGGLAANGQHRHVGLRLAYGIGPIHVSAATSKTRNEMTAGSDFRDTALAGSYSIGTAKLSAGARRFAFQAARQQQWLLAGSLPIGNGEIKASVNHANFSGRVGTTNVDANSATQIGLGYAHYLSKRSAVYATVARISNEGAIAFSEPGGPAGLAAGRSSSGAEVGIRHSF
jgi:predicted porin